MSGRDEREVPSQDEAVRTLQELDARVRELTGHLSNQQLAAPGTVGGGGWSAQDLISHLVSWEELALDTIADWRNRIPPRIHDRFRAAGGIDPLNADLDSIKRGISPAEARRDAAEVHERLVREIASLTPAEWEEPPYYDPPRPVRSLGDLVGGILGAPSEHFAHARDHLEDLRRYVEGVDAS